MTQRHRLLLVDDDAQLTQFLGARLRRDGFDVTVAGSGPDALAAVDDAWPDLVLLDLMMPGMSGEEVAAGIKRRADIPIVVLSAVATSRSKTELIEHYAEDYVTKPFDYPELVARVHRVLRRLQRADPERAARPRAGPVARTSPPRGDRCRPAGRAVADRDAAAGDAGGEPRHHHHDRAAPGPGLERRRRRRSGVRLGGDPPAAAQDRGRPGRSATSPDRPERGLPAGRRRLTRSRAHGSALGRPGRHLPTPGHRRPPARRGDPAGCLRVRGTALRRGRRRRGGARPGADRRRGVEPPSSARDDCGPRTRRSTATLPGRSSRTRSPTTTSNRSAAT